MVTILKNLIEEECCNCGVLFWITSDLHRNIKDNKRTFYCPNGHGQSYRKSRVDELEEQLKAERNENGKLRMAKIELEVENKKLKRKPRKKAEKKKV